MGSLSRSTRWRIPQKLGLLLTLTLPANGHGSGREVQMVMIDKDQAPEQVCWNPG